MALYFYFNETTGDLVYSDQATYDVEGYASLGQQLYTKPSSSYQWVFDSKRDDIKTVTKDPNTSGQINILTSMKNMFSNCRALTSADLSGFDTSNVTNMSNMFSSCSTLISLDLSGFDTSNATTADDMFSACSHLRVIDISSNMSNVLSELPAVTYYDAATRQSYAKAEIPGGSTYVSYITDLGRMATMVQTRMGINVAKHLAHKALKKAGSIDVSGNSMDVVRTEQHKASYDRDTLEIVTDGTGKVTEMWLVTAG